MSKQKNMTDLPNIGDTLAAKLERIGVTTEDELTALGSVEASIRIGAADDEGCYNMLYALEGAIQGVRWHSLPTEVRAKLKEALDEAWRGS